MINKKGLSSIVATISIILLTIVAMGVIASYIIPLVTNNLNEGTECFDYQEYFYFEEEYGYNCRNGSIYGLSIGAEVNNEEIESNVAGFKLGFFSEGESTTIDVIEGEPKSQNGKIRMLVSSINLFEIPKGGEVKTYVYNSTSTIESARVFVILKSGRVCDESDSIKVNYICEETLYR